MKQRENFNLTIYQNEINRWVSDLAEDDLHFIANRSASLYQSVESAGCVDNYRLSRVIDGVVDARYIEARDNGCCGSVDQVFTNRLTGNSFSIGFNYGH